MTAKTIMALIAIIVCLLLIIGCNVMPKKKEEPDEKELEEASYDEREDSGAS